MRISDWSSDVCSSDLLQKTYPDAAISAQPVAMVAAIGSDISRPGLVPDALRALDDAGIAMIAMQHQIRNVDVQFTAASSDFDAAVSVLHKALVEAADAPAEGPHAARCRRPRGGRKSVLSGHRVAVL